MHFGRRFTAVTAAALLSVLLAMPVSAHGHHRRQSTVDTSCPVCTVEGCTEQDGIPMTGVSTAVMTMKAITVTAPV